MNKRKVIFVVRSDSDLKPGGDLVQVEGYSAALRSRGYCVAVVSWRPRLRFADDDLVVIVNVDRPYEVMEICRRVPANQRVIVPVHHRNESIRLLRASESRGSIVRRILSRLRPELRELATFMARTMRIDVSMADRLSAIGRAALSCTRVPRSIGVVLRESRGVVFLSETERRAVQDDFGTTGASHVIAPNGLPPERPGRPWKDRSRRVLVAGRIEPRKRQLEFLRVAESVGLDVDFVGKVDDNSGSYGRAFLNEVELAAHSRWLGPRPHIETLDLMASSRVLVNASWAEVQSLVELEAAGAGCYVVTTDSGSAREHLGANAVVLTENPDLRVLALEAAALLSGPQPPPFRYEHTWDTSAEAILRLAGWGDQNG